jgi:hypothetical protein
MVAMIAIIAKRYLGQMPATRFAQQHLGLRSLQAST